MLGSMPGPVLNKYQELVGSKIPADLAKLIVGKGTANNYIRRGFDNVVFHRELSLGLPDRRNGR